MTPTETQIINNLRDYLLAKKCFSESQVDVLVEILGKTAYAVLSAHLAKYQQALLAEIAESFAVIKEQVCELQTVEQLALAKKEIARLKLQLSKKSSHQPIKHVDAIDYFKHRLITEITTLAEPEIIHEKESSKN